MMYARCTPTLGTAGRRTTPAVAVVLACLITPSFALESASPPPEHDSRLTTQPATTQGGWQLTVSMHGRHTVTLPVEIPDPHKPAALNDQQVDLQSAGSLRLVTFVPHAVVDFALRRDAPNGKPALRLRIEGPATRAERWLVADDLNHAIVSSRIARWMLHAAENADDANRFADRQRRRPHHERALLVATPDGSSRHVFTDLEEGRVLHLPGTGVSVRILRYLPWYSYDLDTKRVANMGDKPVNPALEVEVTTQGTVSRHFVFARRDANRVFASMTEAPPIELRFHQTANRLPGRPRFHLFMTADASITLVTILGETVNAIPIRMNDVIQVPGTDFRFQAVEWAERGELVETWRAASDLSGRPAIEVVHADRDGTTRRFWIGAGGATRIPLATGFLELSFSKTPSRRPGLPPAHPPIRSTPKAAPSD